MASFPVFDLNCNPKNSALSSREKDETYKPLLGIKTHVRDGFLRLGPRARRHVDLGVLQQELLHFRGREIYRFSENTLVLPRSAHMDGLLANSRVST